MGHKIIKHEKNNNYFQNSRAWFAHRDIVVITYYVGFVHIAHFPIRKTCSLYMQYIYEAQMKSI